MLGRRVTESLNAKNLGRTDCLVIVGVAEGCALSPTINRSGLRRLDQLVWPAGWLLNKNPVECSYQSVMSTIVSDNTCAPRGKVLVSNPLTGISEPVIPYRNLYQTG